VVFKPDEVRPLRRPAAGVDIGLVNSVGLMQANLAMDEGRRAALGRRNPCGHTVRVMGWAWFTSLSAPVHRMYTTSMPERTREASAPALSRRAWLAGLAAAPAGLKQRLPAAQIGKLKLSRIIFGGNPVGGWAHSRELRYVGQLMTSYFTDAKVSETLALAEQCGINTILTAPSIIPKIKYHWDRGGKIQFISDCGGGDLLEMVKKSIDAGAAACYIHGQTADRLVSQGDFDQMARALALIRKNGLPAGIGGHDLGTIKGAAAKGLRPDFWMKTLHRTDYPSANYQPQRDNIWCTNPEETAAFMKDLKEPWIAFKTLAAGAIAPKIGFQYAFQNGADFICVGMFDWQVVDNANTTITVLARLKDRERPWRA
jgi:hypothetical protein